MKVLIVDDEKLIRDVIKEYCLGNKYEILEADNGIDAIKKAAEADIIVMDIMMPKMDGFTAYKEIKKKYNINSEYFLYFPHTFKKNIKCKARGI